MSKYVDASHDDSVRILKPDGLTVQMPARLILAIDAVLCRCVACEGDLEVSRRQDDLTDDRGWQAAIDEEFGDMMPTPWAAILSLYETLEEQESC